MKTVFWWLALLNLAGVLVLVSGGLVPIGWPAAASVELALVPIERPAHAAPAAPLPARGQIPERFRPLDLAPRPWDELPGGGVRLRP